jgi:mannose-6-phosphate isomerase-like protein (cupin superfamily)
MRNKRRMDETGAMTARKIGQGFLDGFEADGGRNSRTERQMNLVTKNADANQIRPSIAASEADWLEPEPGVRFKVLASTEQTGGSYACMETIAQKGTGSPLHIHHREDEHFLILEGTAHLVLGEKTLDLPAGQTITMPRGIPHAWSNNSDAALRLIALFSPGGFDQLCIEMATGALDMSKILERFGLEIVGPKL